MESLKGQLKSQKTEKGVWQEKNCRKCTSIVITVDYTTITIPFIVNNQPYVVSKYTLYI